MCYPDIRQVVDELEEILGATLVARIAKTTSTNVVRWKNGLDKPGSEAEQNLLLAYIVVCILEFPGSMHKEAIKHWFTHANEHLLNENSKPQAPIVAIRRRTNRGLEIELAAVCAG